MYSTSKLTTYTKPTAMKIAKLVCVTLMTRVIVDENADEQTIMELAIPKLSEKLMDEPFEHIESIEDDTECPFDINFDLKEGHEVIFNNTADVVLTLGEDEVELEELGWVKKSEIKMK